MKIFYLILPAFLLVICGITYSLQANVSFGTPITPPPVILTEDECCGTPPPPILTATAEQATITPVLGEPINPPTEVTQTIETPQLPETPIVVPTERTPTIYYLDTETPLPVPTLEPTPTRETGFVDDSLWCNWTGEYLNARSNPQFGDNIIGSIPSQDCMVVWGISTDQRGLDRNWLFGCILNEFQDCIKPSVYVAEWLMSYVREFPNE